MKKRHQVLLVLSILSVITFLDRIAISTASNRITKELGLSEVQWGWVLGIFTLSYGIFEIPTGLLGDKNGAKKLLIRVVLWWSFFTILTGFSINFTMLLIVRFLFGMGEAGAYPNISIALSKWFPAYERGYLSTVSFGYLATNYGYNFPVLLLGILVIIGAFLWLKIDAEEVLG